MILIIFTICAIASHHALEELFHLAKNSVLLITPLICSGIVMILKSNRARHYVEHEVDWWTLLFFMLLFAVAGTLEYTHVDQVMAKGFSGICGGSSLLLIPFIFTISAVGSALVDNVIFVAAFSPIIEQLSVAAKDFPLWWALLFGACFGGNITMIGSTANIVALGMLEKRSGDHVSFFGWLKVGLLCTFVAGVICTGSLLLLNPLMSDRASEPSFAQLHKNSGRKFDRKQVIIKGCAAETLAGDMIREGEAFVRVTVPAELRPAFAEAAKSAAAYRFEGKLTTDGNGDYPHVLAVEKIEVCK